MPSDSEATRRWLSDIRHHRRFTSGMNYAAFQGDDRTVYAVTRCLEIISEASRRLPDELKARHPSIEWREMAAAGNIYCHEYEDVGVTCRFVQNRTLSGQCRERSPNIA